MLLALVYRDKTISDQTLSQMVKALPEIVSKNLSISAKPETTLSPSEVGIRCFDTGPFDTHMRAVEIIVVAHDYPERHVKIEEKARAIAREVHEATSCGLKSIQVWVLLKQGGFWQTS